MTLFYSSFSFFELKDPMILRGTRRAQRHKQRRRKKSRAKGNRNTHNRNNETSIR